jgi:hypothetical protein
MKSKQSCFGPHGEKSYTYWLHLWTFANGGFISLQENTPNSRDLPSSGEVRMATAMVSAAISVVGKALAPLTGSLLRDWAASVKLGDNDRDIELELELLTVQALLEPTLGREIDNSALKELLLRLQGLAYDCWGIQKNPSPSKR